MKAHFLIARLGIVSGMVVAFHHLATLPSLAGIGTAFTVTNTQTLGPGSLANAISAANAAGGGTIRFSPPGSFAGGRIVVERLPVTADLCIVGPDVHPLLSIESDAGGGYAFSFDGSAGAHVTLENLSLRNNDANASNPVLTGNASLTVRHCVFPGGRGAISYAPGVDGAELLVEHCLFENLSSVGEVILVLSGAQAPGPTVIRNCVFRDNLGSSRGVLSMAFRGRAEVTGCLFKDNSVQQAGGIFVRGIPPGGVLVIDSCAFIGNHASNKGGAIVRDTTSSGSIHLANCTFDGNSSVGGGGAMSIYGATVTNCTIVGGGSETGPGGAIANPVAGRPVTLSNCLVLDNTSGGVANDLDGEFSPGSRGNILGTVPNGFPSAGNRLGIDAGTAGLGLLVEPAVGLPFRPLEAGGLAIDGGVNSVALDGGGAPLDFDQRGEGFPRIRGAAVDVGAYESPEEFMVTNSGNSGAGSLSQALADAEASGGGSVRFDPTGDFAGRTIALQEQVLSSPISLAGPDVNPPLSLVPAQADRALFRFVSAGGSGGDPVRISHFRFADSGAVLRSAFDLEVSDCVFENNARGIAFLPEADEGKLTVGQCSFSGRSTGAAILVEPSGGSGAAVVEITDCRIETSGVEGGERACELRGTGNVILSRCLFERNVGAVQVDPRAGTTRISNCSFIGNRRATGASAIGRPLPGTGFPLFVWNSTFGGNASDDGSGAVSAHACALVNCTIAENTGGGVRATDPARPARMANCIAVGNVPFDVAGVFEAADGGNVIGAGAGFPETGNITGATFGTSGLQGPRDFGDGRPLYPLGQGGVAVDAGRILLAVDPDGRPLAFDQRGLPHSRVLGSGIDAGAYEADGPPPALFVESFFAEPASVRAGDSTTLRWSVLGAQSTRIDPGVGPVAENSLEVTPPLARRETPISRQSVWRYQDANVDLYSPGVPFYAPAYNDSGWKSGAGRLGYGGDGETTVIEGGPSNNRRIAAYFRKTFRIRGVEDLADVSIGLARDDGAVVFVNGVEAVRDNMPAGAIRSNTLALSAVGDDERFYFNLELNPTLFREGENVIAVAVHQAATNSSDLGFDLELHADFSGGMGYELTASTDGASVVETLRVPVQGLRFGGARFALVDDHAGAPLPGDLDGDGDVDFLYGPDNSSGYVWVENTGAGRLVARGGIIGASNELMIHAIRDITGGPLPELIYTEANGIGYFDNNGSGQAWRKVVLSTSLDIIGAVQVVDIDGDGDDDIVGASSDPPRIGYFENRGTQGLGVFRTIADLSTGTLVNPRRLASGDFDGDGDTDLVVYFIGSGVHVLRNNGAGGFTFSRIDSGQIPNLRELLCVDIDGDGRDEVIARSFASNEPNFVGVFDLSGSTWRYSLLYDTFRPIQSGDYNGDGFPDVLSLVGAGLELEESSGAGGGLGPGYTAIPLPPNYFYNSLHPLAVDIDGDGDEDFLAGNANARGNGGIFFHENLRINDPVIRAFEADRTVVQSGGTVRLSWDVGFTDSLEIRGLGRVTGNTRVVTPTATTTYELVARRDSNSVSAFVQVTVVADSDDDGMDDRWELEHFGNLDAHPDDDPDRDGAGNRAEFESGSDPHARDTDGDGLDDGIEIADGFSDPLLGDTDGDGTGDALEFAARTDPRDNGGNPSALLDGLAVYAPLDAGDILGIPGSPDEAAVRNLAGGYGSARPVPTVVTGGIAGDGAAIIGTGGIGFPLDSSGGPSFSFSVWFRSFSASGTLLGGPGDGTPEVRLVADSVQLDVGGSGIAAMPVLDDAWNHFAFSYDSRSGAYLLTLNGREESGQVGASSGSLVSEPPVSPATVTLAPLIAEGIVWLDEFAYWRRALTGVELGVAHAAGSAGLGLPVLAGPDGLARVLVTAPGGTTAYLTHRFVLDAGIESVGPVTLQWLRDGVELPGENASRLVVPDAALEDRGEYALRVSNSAGTVESDPVLILVREAVPDLVATLEPQGMVFSSSYGQWGADIDGDVAAIGNADVDTSVAGGGMVHVFERNEGGAGAWGQSTVLSAATPYFRNRFGASLAIEDGTLVVGAPGRDSGTVGTVHVFVRRGGEWVLEEELAGGRFAGEFGFGNQVALHDGTLAVSAWKDNAVGAVYVFERSPSGWKRAAVIDAPQATFFDGFGTSLDVNGDVLVVGAPGDWDIHRESGAAYVFERDRGGAGVWGAVLKAKGSHPARFGEFGSAVAVWGGTLVSGSHMESGDVYGDYLYDRDAGGIWRQVRRYLEPRTDDARFRPARSLALHGPYLATLVEDDERFVLRQRVGGTTEWRELAEVIPPLDDAFGDAIAMSGTTILVAPGFIYEQPAVAPIITRQPRVPEDESGVLSVLAAGSGELAYQWFLDGVPLDGATGTSVDAFAEGSGEYRVIVGNAFGSATSRGVEVIPAAPPTIVSQPPLPARKPNGSLQFSVRAEGQGLRYQWFLDDVPIPGADRPAFDLADPNLSDTGTYTVVVSNGRGSVTSEPLAIGLGNLIPFRIGGLRGEDSVEGDLLGWSVAIKGDRMIVGAIDHGDPGAAYVFEDQGVLEGDGWVQAAKLVSGDANANSRFGESVDIDGDLAVVGAPFEDGTIPREGAVYLFERSGDGSWRRVQKLRFVDNPENIGGFGSFVGISGTTVLVGGTGGIHVFVPSGPAGSPAWVEASVILSPIGDGNFGRVFDLAGGWLAVGEQTDDARGDNAGTVFLFKETPAGSGAFVFRRRLFASNAAADGMFGSAVAMDGDTLLVGRDASLNGIGSAYVFARNAGGTDAWGQTAELRPSDGQAADRFGTAVALDHGQMIVGAFGEDTGGGSAGAAYLFARDAAGVWRETFKLADPVPNHDNAFGFSVAISRGQVAIGSPRSLGSGCVHVFLANQPPLVANAIVSSPVLVGAPAAAGFTYSDAENDGPGAHRFQWWRADGPDGAGSRRIEGATNAHYVPVGGDLGAFLSVAITPVAATGYPRGLTAPSAFAGPIEKVDLALDGGESADTVLAGHPTEGGVAHTLTLANLGTTAATNVVIDLSWSDLFRLTTTVGGGVVNGNEWLVSSLRAGESVSLQVAYRAEAGVPGAVDGIRTLAAIGSLDQPDTDPANNIADIATTILSPSSLATTVLDPRPNLSTQSGLLGQRVRIGNGNPLAIPGFIVRISGLPPGVEVRNASGTMPDGTPFILYGQTLAGGEDATLAVEFYRATRRGDFSPVYALALVAAGEYPPPLHVGQPLEVDRVVQLPDHTMLIEWPSVPGRRYAVEYGPDMRNWRSAGPALRAAGTRMQWIDSGPPKTDSLPEGAGRWYRVLMLRDE